MKVVAVIPVHMGSKRLHGKILMEIAGKTILQHTIEQVGKATKINEIWVCATTNKEDDAIEEFLKPKGKQKFYDVNFMRGDEDDIISRIVWVANESKADVIVNCDGEQPMQDPRIIDKSVEIITELGYPLGYIGGTPLGSRVYAFTKDLLKIVYAKYQMTPEMNWYKCFEDTCDYPNLCIDTQADYEFVKGLMETRV